MAWGLPNLFLHGSWGHLNVLTTVTLPSTYGHCLENPTGQTQLHLFPLICGPFYPDLCLIFVQSMGAGLCFLIRDPTKFPLIKVKL